MELKVLENIEISLPQDAVKLIKNLNKLEIEAYVVGGTVRNFLLGYQYSDIDIFCKCSKEFFKSKQIENIEIDFEFDNVCLVTVYENSWSSSKFSVSFNDSFEKDFNCRDYTINSLWYNVMENKVIGFDVSFDDIEGDNLMLCNKDTMNGLIYLRGIRLASSYGLLNRSELIYDRTFKDIDTRFKAIRLRNEVSKHNIRCLMERNLLGRLVTKLSEFNIHI